MALSPARSEAGVPLGLPEPLFKELNAAEKQGLLILVTDCLLYLVSSLYEHQQLVRGVLQSSLDGFGAVTTPYT
jgi:hypothetical protein